MSVATVVFLGLVNWLATTIVVESEATRPMREWIERKRYPQPTLEDIVGQLYDYQWHLMAMLGLDIPKHEDWRWRKVHYFVQCHLCTGTWIGLVTAAVFGSPFPGLPGVIAGGLLYKAIGHLVLELRPQAWRQ